MPQLPILSAKKIIKAFEGLGYVVIRQKGSHIRLVKERRPSITVPNYKTIDRSLLVKILRDASVSEDTFLDQL